MARTHARILTSIWRDPDWRALTHGAQGLYVLLLSQPDLSYCGVVALRYKRWAQMAADTSKEDVVGWLKELATARFIVLDTEVDEVLLRTFLTHDGVLEQPNVCARALTDLEQVESTQIRDYVEEHYGPQLREAAERRTGARNPSAKGSRNPSAKGSGDPSGNGSADGSGEWGRGEPQNTSNGDTRARTDTTSARAERRARATAPPTRDELLTDKVRAWHAENTPGVDLDRAADEMIDWATGKGERKNDWAAALRNWLRRAQDDPRRSRPAPAVTAAVETATRARRNLTQAELERLADMPDDEKERALARWRAGAHEVFDDEVTAS